METAEKLRVSKTSLEVTNQRLEAELEETKQRLQEAVATPPTATTAATGAEGRKSSVLTR